MTDLLSMLNVIIKCSKYSRKISATMLGIGDPIANTLNGS
jgi:hypothetical protein